MSRFFSSVALSTACMAVAVVVGVIWAFVLVVLFALLFGVETRLIDPTLGFLVATVFWPLDKWAHGKWLRPLTPEEGDAVK